MGLQAQIFKHPMYTGCSAGGISARADRVTLINIPGPVSSPTDDAPAAILMAGNTPGTVKIVPAVRDELTGAYYADPRPPMAGGAFVATSDSRFREAIEKLIAQRFYGAVALHDRFEA